MLGTINKNLKPETYQLTLCKPNRQTIAYLSDAYDIVYTAQFLNVDELEFKIPYYISDSNHKKIKNPNWDLIKGDYLVLLNDEKYFLIDIPKEDGGDKLFKTVKCYSLEQELRRKIIRGYKFDSRVLYTLTDERDINGVPLGVLNYLSTLMSWDIGYVDPDLISISNRKYRQFDINEKTIYDAMQEIMLTFSCVFMFDTINKVIDIYRIAEIGMNRGLYISEENYIKTIGKEPKHGEIVTRLYCYGKDDLTIISKNPAGTPYIEDYSYYKTTEYMTQGLIDSLNVYEALIESRGTEFSGYLTQLSDLQTLLLEKQVELTTLKTELEVIEDSIDAAIKAGTSYSDLRTQRNSKNSEISAKEAEIATVQTNIDNVNANITSLRTLLSKENNFTADQIVELDYYVREKVWSDTNYIDAQDLYDEGVNQLHKLNQPTTSFNIEAVDFLNIVECQFDWDKLVLGDIININYPKFNIDIQVRLVAYTHDSSQNGLTLTFSNKDSAYNPNVFLNEILDKATSSSTTIDMSKFKWDKAEDNETQIHQILTSNWDAAKNAVLAGRNQDITINERGIVLIDKDNPLYQMRILSNVIALSRDGFETAALCITPNGISSEQLIGQIVASERLIITNTAGNFIVDELGVLVENLKLTVTRQDNLSRTTIDPFVGIKIQKNVNGAFEDRLFIDNEGNVNAQSFKVMNTNSVLDDTGLTIFNGKINIEDNKGNVAFGADASGNLNLIGSITTPYGKMNKDGLTITGGKMQLINDAGTVVIDGEHNIHKIMMTGQTTITIPAGNTNYNTILTTLNLTDENGQPYIPVCHVYQQMDNGIMGLCPTFNVGAGTSGLAIRQVIRASADMSSLNLYVNRCSEEAVDPLTINVRYYVYKEMAF